LGNPSSRKDGVQLLSIIANYRPRVPESGCIFSRPLPAGIMPSVRWITPKRDGVGTEESDEGEASR